MFCDLRLISVRKVIIRLILQIQVISCGLKMISSQRGDPLEIYFSGQTPCSFPTNVHKLQHDYTGFTIGTRV